MTDVPTPSTVGSDPSLRQTTRPAARPVDVRLHNLALILQQVAASGSTSRAELARITDLTKGTVSTLVQELIRLGLLVELGVQQDGGRGRPRMRLSLNGEHLCGIGLEINVDYVAVCVADLLHRVRFHRIEAVDNRGIEPPRVLDRAARLVRTGLDEAEADGLSPAGIGVAVPGTVALGERRLLVGPNLGWSNVAIGDELFERLRSLDAPILVDNEANLAALGELWLGIGGESGDYIHISGEIGVGAGFIVDGALFRGSRGLAGEIGHVVVDPDGPVCSCGGKGCLERVAGQDAILRGAGLPTTTSTSLGLSENPLRDLLGLLESGDERALTAVANAAKALGTGLSGVVNMIDPDTIVLGGTYATLAPWLAKPLEHALAAQVIASEWRQIRIRASTLGPDAAVRGAASWIIQQILAAPGQPILNPGPLAALAGV
jgi:predicted NBD/HSP70 family sugar kinase